jgi:2-oxoisovalerate dehydrogenase E1 component alpha subunit
VASKNSVSKSASGEKRGLKKPLPNGAVLAKSSSGLKLKTTPVKGRLEVSKQASPDVSRETVGKSGGSSGKNQAGSSAFRLPTKELLRVFDGMVKARCLEERLIRMYKQNDGYFWIGGPGEEAFNIPLGLQVKKGQGLDYDFLHLHYRSSGIVLMMGAEPMDMIRQMKNTVTDPFSGGRNFGNHTSIRKWNVVPISSTIETQYATAIGTGIAQRQHGGDAITIVNGGDAGTAEGEFASCLVWASRPGSELPILMIVTNNEYGISTPARTQHGEKHIADRGTAFGIKNRVINGNDVEESYLAIQEAMAYVRKERKPFLLEARVSRLYGHSSASGANFVQNEEDPLVTFERKLVSAGAISKAEADALRERYTAEFLDMAKKVKEEPMPDGSTIYDHTFKGQKGRYF